MSDVILVIFCGFGIGCVLGFFLVWIKDRVCIYKMNHKKKFYAVFHKVNIGGYPVSCKMIVEAKNKTDAIVRMIKKDSNVFLSDCFEICGVREVDVI